MDWKFNSTPILPKNELSSPTRRRDTELAKIVLIVFFWRQRCVLIVVDVVFLAVMVMGVVCMYVCIFSID